MWKDYKDNSSRLSMLQKGADAALERIARSDRKKKASISRLPRPVKLAMIAVPVLAVVSLAVLFTTLLGSGRNSKV
jgi:hypothetical protein